MVKTYSCGSIQLHWQFTKNIFLHVYEKTGVIKYMETLLLKYCYLEDNVVVKEIYMNDLAMKRVGAFIIDYVILCFFAGMASTIGMIAVADKWMQNPSRYFIWFMFAPFICSILLMGIWFFILDICGKLDPGKRLMRIELLSHGQKFTVSTSMKHSVLKTLFCCIWPISFIYYILKHEMIYDKFLKISVRSQAER